MKAAIYARYSSDNQREASIDDQVRRCRAWIEREKATETEVFADYAISGTSADRPRFKELINAARAHQIDVVIAESLDRISRDQEHIAGFFKQMRFNSVRIITLFEGEISELHVGLKGTMSALFLKDLGDRTHRGMEGRVRAGKNAGGLSYGYRVVRTLTADGVASTGDRIIDETESQIINRIFKSYVDGKSPRSIAHQLNREGVPGARGGKWTASLILGNATRETGILRNRLYAGEIVWNRQHYEKNPDTGKRQPRPNPLEQWIIEAVPELRLIDPALWQAAQSRLLLLRQKVSSDGEMLGPAGTPDSDRQPPSIGQRLSRVRRPVWPLAGLVRCGVCDGAMTIVGSGGRLGCSNHVERRTCTNNRSMLRDRLLDRVFDGLKQRLLAPELVERFVESYVREVNASNCELGNRRARLTAEQVKISRQIKTILDTIKEIGGSRSLVDDLRALERRQDEIATQISSDSEPERMPDLHPKLPEIYRQRVALLAEALNDPETGSAATEALRSLIDAITFHPEPGRGQYRLGLRGDLAVASPWVV